MLTSIRPSTLPVGIAARRGWEQAIIRWAPTVRLQGGSKAEDRDGCLNRVDVEVEVGAVWEHQSLETGREDDDVWVEPWGKFQRVGW
jgi:hypothetical protein